MVSIRPPWGGFGNYGLAVKWSHEKMIREYWTDSESERNTWYSAYKRNDDVNSVKKIKRRGKNPSFEGKKGIQKLK